MNYTNSKELENNNKYFKQFILPLFIVIISLYLQALEFYYIGSAFIICAAIINIFYCWYDNQILYYYPKFEKSSSNEKWVEITDTELQNIKIIISNYKEINKTSYIEFVIALLFVIILANSYPYFKSNIKFETLVGSNLNVPVLVMIIINVILGFIWYYFSRPFIWMPNLIEFKLHHFENLSSLLKNVGIYDWKMYYQVKLEKASKALVPTDIRAIIKPPYLVPEFYGVQAQISINSGLPYMYFVVITSRNLPIYYPNNYNSQLDIIEFKQDNDVNILIIRQFTTKKTGYYTNNSDIVRLLRLVKSCVELTLYKNSISV